MHIRIGLHNVPLQGFHQILVITSWVKLGLDWLVVMTDWLLPFSPTPSMLQWASIP